MIKEEKIINIEKIIFFGSLIQEYFLRLFIDKLIGKLNKQKQNKIKTNNKNISEDNLILTLNTPIKIDKNKKLNFKKLSLVINDKYII